MNENHTTTLFQLNSVYDEFHIYSEMEILLVNIRFIVKEFFVKHKEVIRGLM
jgi:hypothetical protein